MSVRGSNCGICGRAEFHLGEGGSSDVLRLALCTVLGWC